MSATPKRFLIIGSGSIGRRHAANLRTLAPSAEFGLLRQKAQPNDLSEALGACLFESLDAAIDWRPTLAVVATPSRQHATMALRLLAASIPTFIEKPVAITEGEVTALDALGAGAMATTQVGCVLRFLPSLQHLKRYLDEERLGTIIRVVLEVGQYLPDWRPGKDYRQSYSVSSDQGGGVVFDLIHELDLAHWLFGDVSLLGAWGDHRSHLELDVEDVATLMLRGKTGEQIMIQMDYVSRPPIRRLHIVGDRGSATWDLNGQSLEIFEVGEVPQLSRDGFDIPAAHFAAIEEFLHAVDGAADTRIPLREALPATRMAIAAVGLIRRQA